VVPVHIGESKQLARGAISNHMYISAFAMATVICGHYLYNKLINMKDMNETTAQNKLVHFRCSFRRGPDICLTVSGGTKHKTLENSCY
jgi:hypothetical protein